MALAIGVIGFYRVETANNDTMWSMVADGLVRTAAASANISRGASIHVQGTSVTIAAADIGSAGHYFGRHGQQLGMVKVASALAQAGYYLTVDQDAKRIAVAKEYINQFPPIVNKYLSKTSNPALLGEVINKLSTVIPPELQQDWSSN
ncbi:MAG: hypothetical protein K6T83_09000 [Alicyclobacillus sp.]|nr:hypothetical protein [Alicyclobacillus sp.]